MSILSGALLGILEEAGVAVLTLTEGLEPEEFFSSRITQLEVLRQMSIMTETAANVPDDLKLKMVEIDWAGWAILGVELKITGSAERDALWFGVRSLVPATLMWMRVYKNDTPELFSLMT